MNKLATNLKKHRGIVSGVALILTVAAIFWLVNSPAVVGAAATQRVLPIYSVQRNDKMVALSFDAAWGNEDTQSLIDTLGKYGVNATFFVVGDWVDKYPESVKALADAGNEVMNHSSSHAHFAKMPAEEIMADINACNAKIEKITGVCPTLFRCPYGEYDDNVISTVNSMGMKAIQWDVDSLDWKKISATEISSRVLKNVKSGSIILFHNAAENTPAALPGIIEALQADGYTIVPISKLLLEGDYTIDAAGCQCPLVSSATGPASPAPSASQTPADASAAPDAASPSPAVASPSPAVASPAPKAASPSPAQITTLPSTQPPTATPKA